MRHHGILGQRWGRRNGPPYPLGSGDHSAAERKAGKSGWSKEAQSQFSRRKKTPSSNVSKSRQTTKNQNGNGPKTESKTTSKDISKYRSEMIDRYSKTDPEKAQKYKNASEKELAEEYERRKKIEKTVVAAAAVVGITAACYLAYRSGILKRLSKSGITNIDDALKETLDDIVQESLDDIDYVIRKGDTLHRMVSFKNFDVSKTAGKATYVTTLDIDRSGYMAFLKDWHGTGKRYDVSLEAIKDIVAPSDTKARQIFQELWDSNPSYRKDLKNTLIETYSKLLGFTPEDPYFYTVINSVDDALNDDPFQQAIYAIVKGKDDSKTLISAYKAKGYSAIVDYFDKGEMAKQPMILFNADTDVVKTGEQYTTIGMRILAAYDVMSDSTHPLHAMASTVKHLSADDLKTAFNLKT